MARRTHLDGALAIPVAGGSIGSEPLRAAPGALVFSLRTNFGPSCLGVWVSVCSEAKVCLDLAALLNFSHLLPDGVSSKNIHRSGDSFLLLVHGASTEKVPSPRASATFTSASRSLTPILTTTMSRFAGRPGLPLRKACLKALWGLALAFFSPSLRNYKNYLCQPSPLLEVLIQFRFGALRFRV